jgi:exodeoxyribonuclease VII small subunit
MSEEAKSQESEASFSDAMEELERILKGIEDEQIDIDHLGEELGRAAELLEVCRAKIRRAEVEVTQIVQGIEEAAGETEGAAGPE